MPTVETLRREIQSGDRTYPIFVGFLSASEILEVAEAPGFAPETPQQGIAVNILTPPIQEWQRPIDTRRVERISHLFDNTGELMPNPVLLCENAVSGGGGIRIEQQRASGGIPTNIWLVDVPPNQDGGARPLWIIDGQHRINGLAASAQSTNPLPVVLLLNEGPTSYTGPDLAKLFAQVTTEAQKLDELHDEWLTFAFRLGDYADSSREPELHRRSMQAVAELCRKHTLSSGHPNPFFDQVRFNIHRSAGPSSGGFSYNCIELKQLVLKHYYRSSASRSHLSPSDLADQIGLAYTALTRSVAAPHAETVFFGDGDFGQTIMQDAFLIGVFAFLLNHGKPDNWMEVLDTLEFPTTVWNFRNWVRTLSGPAATVSRKVSTQVFTAAFRDYQLPPGGGDLADTLRGNDAKVKVTFSFLSPSGRASRRQQEVLEVSNGAVLSKTVGARRHIRIESVRDNIGKIIVADRQSPPGRVIEYGTASRSGMTLDPAHHSNPLSLLIRMALYGGGEASAQLEVSWSEESDDE